MTVDISSTVHNNIHTSPMDYHFKPNEQVMRQIANIFLMFRIESRTDTQLARRISSSTVELFRLCHFPVTTLVKQMESMSYTSNGIKVGVDFRMLK